MSFNASALSNSCLPNSFFNESERRFILATHVVLFSVIFFMGLLLNTLSIVVLKRDIRRSSMSVLLLALAVFDLTFIILSVPYFVVYMGLGVALNDSSGLPLQRSMSASPASHVILPLVWFLGGVARTGRNWVILIVALDRYMVVQNPFLSTQRSNPHRSRVYCLCVTLTAVLYNLPLLMESRIVIDDCMLVPVVQINPQQLGQRYMIVYKKIMYIVFLSSGPVVWLCFFNILLIRSLMVASRIRAAITRETTRRTEETKMLVMIIAVFVLTETPGAIWHLLMDTVMDSESWFNSYFYSTGSLLTLINSAVNFFIYCVWSRSFRRNMLYTLRRRKRPPPRVIRFESDSDKTRQMMLLAEKPAGVTQQHQIYTKKLQQQQQQQQKRHCKQLRFV